MTSSTTTRIDPLYVIDTHALVWDLTGDTRLSARAAEIFRAAERGETRLVISVIVVAELYYLNQKKKVFDDFAALYHLLKTGPQFQLVGFFPDEVLDFAQDAGVPEMHDRIIAGLARRLDVPLLTVDAQITASGTARIEW